MTAADWMDIGMAGTMLVWATWQDVRSYTIPLVAIVYGVLAGLITAWTFHGGYGLLEAGIGGLLGGGLGWVLVRVVKLGEGDAGLFLALGVIFGPVIVLSVFIASNVLILLRFLVPVLRKKKIRIAVAPYILAATAIVECLHWI
ncbi:prepilin peptidase [Alicyclobacillus tolerans]|uniref:prepilin peptidase n=1 Tax=Alicyclobacillus tolerans TaxID=90970 RepID=UPI001EFFB0CD|nr:prepilin peptidase [Alicyclobacillus tolerans]MCF8567415.1 prepilin peptidase [Alicyclobacillus tolerans]